MFTFFEGIVEKIEKDSIVLLVNGIGFCLKVGDPYFFKTGEKIRIYTHLAIRENDLTLYGFKDEKELKLFEQLLKVGGIGPKSALAIVASKNIVRLQEAIENDDLTLLTKFPGVGKKTAQQIILDLKGKLEIGDDEQNILPDSLTDAKDALLALGYNNREVDSALKKLTKKVGLSTQEYIKLGLNLLMER